MLHGQWLGRIQGTNNGHALLSVDNDRPNIAWLQVTGVEPMRVRSCDATMQLAQGRTIDT
jgi:hypothetical protein